MNASLPVISLALLVILANPFAWQAQGAERDWVKFVKDRSQHDPPQPDQVICIGSSHMQLWKTVSRDLTPLTVYNFGIGGTTMKDAADEFARNLAIPYKPRAILLYEGSNDIARGTTTPQILKQFREFYSQIHQALPQTHIYVLGIVPSPGKRFEQWETIQATNASLKKECDSSNLLTYIDTTSGLIGPDHKPRMDCFIPGDIHMNPKGYEVWARAVAPVVTGKAKTRD